MWGLLSVLLSTMNKEDLMQEVVITTEFIKLDQFLKFAELVDSGGVAKLFIKEELVRVNSEVCTSEVRSFMMEMLLSYLFQMTMVILLKL